MFSIFKLALVSFAASVLAVPIDEPVRSDFHQVRSDVAYIGKTLSNLGALIQAFPDSGGQDDQTTSIYYYALEVIDATQFTSETVWGFNYTNGPFNDVEARNLVDLTEELIPPLENVLGGFFEKQPTFEAVGLSGSAEQLKETYYYALVDIRDSFAQLLNITTEFLPDDFKEYFQSINGQLGPVFEPVISAYKLT